MTFLSTRNRLAVAVVLAWPVGNTWSEPSSDAVKVARAAAGQELPLQLTMTHALSDPSSSTHVQRQSVRLPISPGTLATWDSTDLLVARLQLDRRLSDDSPKQIARVDGVASRPRPAPEPEGRQSGERVALLPSSRVDTSSSGKGSADRVVDEDFNQALMHYVRLQMPVLPLWTMPPPNAPVRPVQFPEDVPAAAVAQSPGTQAVPPKIPRRTPLVRARGVTPPGVLHGRAWRLSDEAYKAFSRGDYTAALQRVNAALQLQPEVVRLHQLRVYTLQKLNRAEEAQTAAEQALAQGLVSSELQAAVKNLEPAPPGAATVPTTPEYRKAFPIATLAFEQLAAGRFADAASNAEIAFRTDPSQEAWALLWLNALTQQQKYEEVIVAGKQAIDLGAPNRDVLLSTMRLANQAVAGLHAGKAYEALSKGQLKQGVLEAQAAVQRAPDMASYRILLITALQAAQDLSAAEQVATDALLADDENTTVQLQRAYLRQQLGRGQAAQEDVAAVLAQAWIDDGQRRNARLIGADLALANSRPDQALALLELLDPASEQVQARRKSAAAMKGLWASAETLPVTAYAPLQMCRDTPYGTVCEMQPWDAPGTDNPSARAYAAYAQKRYAEAIVLARMAVAADPKNDGNETLLTTTLAAGTTAQQQEAISRLDAALENASQDANLLRQRAYLRLVNHQPDLALQDFVAARSTGNAPPTNVMDEAYALAAMGNRPTAAAILKQAINDADEGKLALNAQQRFDTRSAIASFSREWGVTASVGYRGSRAASNGLIGQPISVPGNAAFSTVEAYWRPADVLNSSNSVFDVYGRLSNTLYAGTDRTGAQSVSDPCGGTINVIEARSKGAAGLPTTTGTVGMRYTPSTETNLTFGLERQFFIGNASRSGSLNPASDAVRCLLNQQASAVQYRNDAGAGAWQAYMLYGFYEGTGLRLDAKSWFTMEGYLQAGYTLLDAPTAYTLRDSTGQVLGQSDGKLKRGQAFAASEVRIGRSFLTDYSDRLVLFPHVSLAADWYSNRSRVTGSPVPGNSSFRLVGSDSDWSAGAGVGVNMRYWLAGDRYNAQSSYIDGSLQYRTRLGGVVDRAKGLFLSVSFSY